jgi:hypothetical protein
MQSFACHSRVSVIRCCCRDRMVLLILQCTNHTVEPTDAQLRAFACKSLSGPIRENGLIRTARDGPRMVSPSPPAFLLQLLSLFSSHQRNKCVCNRERSFGSDSAWNQVSFSCRRQTAEHPETLTASQGDPTAQLRNFRHSASSRLMMSEDLTLAQQQRLRCAPSLDLTDRCW